MRTPKRSFLINLFMNPSFGQSFPAWSQHRNSSPLIKSIPPCMFPPQKHQNAKTQKPNHKTQATSQNSKHISRKRRWPFFFHPNPPKSQTPSKTAGRIQYQRHRRAQHIFAHLGKYSQLFGRDLPNFRREHGPTVDGQTVVGGWWMFFSWKTDSAGVFLEKQANQLQGYVLVSGK